MSRRGPGPRVASSPPVSTARASSAILVLLAGALCLLLAAAPGARGPDLRAVAWTPGLDPQPVFPGPVPADVDAQVAAMLTADDVARGLGALALLPADHPLALTPEQRQALAPTLSRARDARSRVDALRQDRLALQATTTAAWRPVARVLQPPVLAAPTQVPPPPRGAP